ncbi:hypothetical protein BR93DRAFT_932158 [Coniochaeta sp. PMI_546]|nr:hypothetical protein BR93DRAFT_932158 [Coniochaeta sp. PMI_546]
MSDEVSDFLRSVEELKERREQEDEARSRELEEKFLRERSERQARRAERARSISPQKSSPANTPPPPSRDGSSAHNSNALGIRAPSPRHESPGSPVTRARPPSAMMDGSRDYAKENESPFDADSKQSSSGSTSSSIGGPARGPLSWQRRPQSQASDRPKSRPLSVVAAENAASRTSTPVEQTPSEQNPSRDQIAQALAGKDPTWFRQTADRAQGSAAFRKNQVEDPDTLDMSSLRAQLPGMSRESSSEPLREAAEIRPASPGIRAKLGSPLILSPAQRLEPPTPEATSQKDITAGGRTSPTRPLSPTKGMGGFVQSAMMKRSDSVKRWSVNSPAGLQRADSAVSNRSSIDNTHRTSTTLSHSRQNSTLRDGSVTPTRSSRPTSRGTTTPTSRPMSSHDQEQDRHDRGSSNDEKPATDTKADQEEQPLPVSPSKTMDPRRWSPTKSSWLDAALNKPDSPKPKPTPPTAQQPAWMVELNKAKSQKSNSGSPDIGATSPVTRKHEVKTGGLMKSSPMGAGVKPAALGASTLSSPRLPPGDKPALGSLRGNLTRRASDKIDQEGAATSSIPAKTKPQTPPKKDLDFRGNLKPRQTPSGAGTSETPDELKNVFGKLRRTQTQNYKAPDELKNNILRGKAALNITGGPKPSDRKDEFKEAILKKKEEFKKAQEEGRSVTKTPKAADEKPIPEGLLKTMEMKRSATTSKRDSAIPDVPPQTPIGFSESNRSSTISSISRSDSAAASQLSTPKPAVSSENEPPTSMPTLQKEVSAPGRLQGRAAASGLAGRFNPALAGILARGPPGAGSGAPKTSSSSSPQVTSEGAAPEAKSSPGPQLTHMTKNRARGPRRKAPSSVAKTTEDAEPAAPAPAVRTPTLTQSERFEPKTETPEAAESVKHDKPALAPKPHLVSLVDSSKTLATKENPTSVAQVISLVDSSKKTAVEEEPKPSGQPISFGDPAGFKTRPRSPTKVHEKVAALVAQAQPVSKPAVDADETTSQPPSPRKLNVKRISKFLDEPVQIDTASDTPKARTPSPTKLGRFAFETDLPSGTSRALPLPPTKSRPLPELVPTASQDHKSDEKVDSEPVVSVKNAKSLFGGAPVKSPEPTRSKPVPADPKPAAETQRPRTPPKPSSRALPPPPETALVSPPMSPMTKYNREVSAVLTSFFGTERPKRSYNVDAAEILMRRPASGARVRTQQAQLFQVSGDGKKQPVPAHNERVLFEREMYLCPHTFTTEVGKKVVEVYFWAGDEVPESAVEDAQVFLQREARAFGGKLVKLTQGKETPEFIQALGGIVIVRRGSSNKYDSLAPNMLCGRRYHGQIAFDEVDFAPSSLCSGFPYLITQQGKCFLWKGKGSDVDELSCARLIGMDLALMGELVEVEDGNEPDEFWRIFGGGSRLGSADHWRLKPNYDKYCGRLFKSDAADRKQIIELSPFSQADLLPTSIYILDAFFEMYIIVGAQAQHQYAAFHNALEFAQEYAILASGMEDRPFVPVSTVVLEGIPRDLKSVFRKWRDSASPTVMNPTFPPGSPLKRGRSLRVVPLNQALQALRE